MDLNPNSEVVLFVSNLLNNNGFHTLATLHIFLVYRYSVLVCKLLITFLQHTNLT